MAHLEGEALGRRTRVLALLGLVGIVEFLLAAVALHAVSLSNEPSHMSEFVHSRFWLVWVLGLYTFVLGCTALIVALRPWLQQTLWQRVGMGMLALAGLAAFVLATFPVDKGRYETTLIGTIHNDATLTTFMMLSCAMVVLGPAFRATPAWRSFARLSLTAGVLAGILGIVYMVATEEDLAIAAYAQRVLVAIIMSWFLLIALRLRRAEAAPGLLVVGASAAMATPTATPVFMAPADASPGRQGGGEALPGASQTGRAGSKTARKGPAAKRARGPRPHAGEAGRPAASSKSRQSRSRTPRAT